jgi:type II secretory pathway pseudopilin PulG
MWKNFNSSAPLEPGFTLVETMVSLLVFLAVLAGVVPVYISYQLTTLQNPVRAGAVSVAQRIMESIRQVADFGNLPDTDTVTNTTPLPQAESFADVDAYGKKYKADIQYCEAPRATFCDDKSRFIRVKVYQKFANGTITPAPVYEVSTVYTKFETE